MLIKIEDPAALAGARRADVTMLSGKIHVTDSTPSAMDLQVRSVVAQYAVSLSLALVIAELAFSSGRAK
jgi:hypothetical protein